MAKKTGKQMVEYFLYTLEKSASISSELKGQWKEIAAYLNESPNDRKDLILQLHNASQKLSGHAERYLILQLGSLKADAHDDEKLNDLLDNFPEDANILAQQAEDAFTLRDFLEARRLYDDLKQKFPGYPIDAEREEKIRKHLENQETEGDHNSETDSISLHNNMPKKAQDLYRSARSYIKGGDLELAQKTLEQAIEAADKQNFRFDLAQEELDNVRIIVTRRKMRKEAFELLKREPPDYGEVLTKLDEIPEDPQADRAASALKQLLQLQDTWDSKNAKEQTDALNKISVQSTEVSSTPLYKALKAEYSKKQKNRRIYSTLGTVLAIVAFIVICTVSPYLIRLLPTPIPTLTTTTTPTFTQTLILTSTVTETVTLTLTATLTPTASVTNTPITTSTPSTFGVVIADYSVYSKTTGAQDDYAGTLKRGQSFRILREEDVSNQIWYLCEWVNNGLSSQGWIQAERVQLLNIEGVSQPTPVNISTSTSTPSITPRVFPSSTPTP